MDEQNGVRLEIVAWALDNLCKPGHSPPDLKDIVPCLPLLTRLVFHGDDQVSNYAGSALVSLSKEDCIQLKNKVGSDFCHRLLLLCKWVFPTCIFHFIWSCILYYLQSTQELLVVQQTTKVLSNLIFIPICELLYSPLTLQSSFHILLSHYTICGQK